jgi:hypothetical protein
LHFIVRLLGLVGLLAVGVGLAMALFEGLPASWRDAGEVAYAAVTTRQASPSTWLVLGGAAAILLALLVEALVVLRFAAGRRSAFGLNALLQASLAVALFVGVNVFSFEHFLRFDWTRSRQFTLPESVRRHLEQLDPDTETRVIVYQRHKTFGNLTDKPDRYDYAAERKVVEKLKDLVEQLRELGKRFDVQVLDVEEDGFDEQLARVTAGAPALRQAIDRAPENSIFLYTDGHVQQMSFNEFFLLDRQRSVADNGGRGNLVLLAQGRPWQEGEAVSGRGVEPFARKVLQLDQRKPRVGVLVMHELLTTEGSEGAFNLRGLRKSLERNGFEVRDVVLRRFSEAGQPEPAADTAEESKLDRLDADLEDFDAELQALRLEVRRREAEVAEMDLKQGENEEDKLDALSRKYARELRGRRLTSEDRKDTLALRRMQLARVRAYLEDRERERNDIQKERDRLPVDELQEAQRMKDVKAKLDRVLADCDLLFIPRLTRRQNGSLAAPYRFHRLSEAQLASVREFVEKGKPLFACLGPSTEPPELNLPPDPEPDGLDRLLGELGVRLGKKTVLFSADSRAFSDRRQNPFRADESVQAPPLDFAAAPPAWRGRWAAARGPELKPNPIREGMRVLGRSVGQPASRLRAAGGDEPPRAEGRAGAGEPRGLDVSVRFPRPVYYESVDPAALAAYLIAITGGSPACAAGPAVASAGPACGIRCYFESLRAIPKFEPTFLVTAEGWNEDRPYPVRGHKPHYEDPKEDDPDTGTLDEKRRGAFPVGIAVEARLPASAPTGSAQTERLAVLGQGDVFVGDELSPAKERLLLQTANWLLGRDDYLPRDDQPWSYPRVDRQRWQTHRSAQAVAAVGLACPAAAAVVAPPATIALEVAATDVPPDRRAEQLVLWGLRLGLPALCAFLGLAVLLVRRLR